MRLARLHGIRRHQLPCRESENERLCSEHPEQQSPIAMFGEQTAEQRPKQGCNSPDARDGAKNAPPQFLRKQDAHGDITSPHDQSRSYSLQCAPREEQRDRGRQGAHDASAKINSRRQRKRPAQTAPFGKPPSARPADDRAKQIGCHRPREIGIAANIAHDARHRGCGDQCIGRVEPDAQANKCQPREAVSLQKFAPRSVHRRKPSSQTTRTGPRFFRGPVLSDIL